MTRPPRFSAVPADFPAPGSGHHDPPPPKDLLAPNEGKQLVIAVAGESWARMPLQTQAFHGGEDFSALIAGYITAAIGPIRADPKLEAGLSRSWYVVVGEKVIAIAQGRFQFWWDIEPGWWARTLSRFVLKLPTGVGLSSPWTMQMAIQEVGLPRILLAAAVSAVGKVAGQRGWFYRVAGHDVNAIDGPGGKVVYPGNASAKLPPKDPDQAAGQIRRAIVAAVPGEVGNRLGGVVIIDANDLGRNVLGRDSDRDDEFFAQLFADNPAGQDRQQTPVLLCLELSGGRGTSPPARPLAARPQPSSRISDETVDPQTAAQAAERSWATSRYVGKGVGVTNLSDQAGSALDAAKSGSGVINRLHRIGVRSEYAYIAGFTSIGLSYLSYFLSRGKKGDDKAQSDRWGIFIGHWAPTFFALGIALKLEEESDR